MSEQPIEVLERWELCGGTWSIRCLSSGAVEIDLCTCYGEPVDDLRSSDPAFLAQLAERLRARPG
jgi:hypothetical protein